MCTLGRVWGSGFGQTNLSFSVRRKTWIRQEMLVGDGPRHFFFHRANVIARGATSFGLGVLVDFVMDHSD